MFKKMSKDFFIRDALTVAKDLLGKFLVTEINGVIVSGKIVETEAYIARLDKASHAYGGRKTNRVMPLYAEGGISYVYFIYGKYFCFNVITGQENDAQGVLIRALEPIDGLDIMSKNRFNKNYIDLTKKQILNLTSGPSKLCMALNIDRQMNQKDLMSNEIYIAQKEETKDEQEGKFNDKEQIVECRRIGIDYAEEAINFPWRFYIKNNPYVSTRDKEAEKNLNI